MSDLNTVSIIGRLTKDAELKKVGKDLTICTFSIAVRRSKFQEKEWVKEVYYFDLSLFENKAKSLRPFLIKGKQIAITGHLEQEKWESDGKTKSAVVIKADEIHLLSGGQKQEIENVYTKPNEPDYTFN